MPPEPHHRARAYGLNWASALPLVQFPALDDPATVDVAVAQVTALVDRSVVTPVRAGAVLTDGTRFPWRREAVFDMIAGQRIAVCPGPAWSGALPHAFYGTVVAHLLAWRGAIPFHACAVAVDGRAVLIAGEARAGKSSLTAGMIAAGATLLSDDLSAVDWAQDGPCVFAGRTTLRLDPQVAEWSAGTPLDLPARDRNGKTVLRFDAPGDMAALPLAGVIALGIGDGVLPPLDRARFLARHLFRPVWLAALPNHLERQRALLLLAAQVRVVGFAAVSGGGLAAHRARAAAAMALARRI